MRKSVIIATVTIVIAVALVATYVWYGDDGGDGGSDTPENTEPVLSNYINTSSFFELYIDGTMITPFNMPCPLEPQGNVIELRPTDRVASVTDNNDGTYGFTLTNDSGEMHTLTVETENMSNIESSVSDRIITLTFDAKSGGEIHPRALTHLYADRPLVVYGRVPKSTNGVTCQLTGRSAAAPYDAVFAFDFAEATHTARDLRRAWAARAMFDLLAEYAENPSAALLQRIEAFSRAYGVPNPYRRGK